MPPPASPIRLAIQCPERSPKLPHLRWKSGCLLPLGHGEVARLRLDIDEVLESLPADLRKLAEMLTEMTEYAASRRLGKSRRQVANDVARLHERFEDAGLRDYL